MRARALLLLLAACLIASPLRAQSLKDDLKARRSRMMERLGPNSMLILFSAEEKVYSKDVNYEFRQDSNMYYLTGVEQPDTILVLMPGNQERKEILFVKPSNPTQEHWTGHVLTPQEVTQETGVATVYSTTQFDQFLQSVLSGQPYQATAQEFETFARALSENRAKVQLILGRAPGVNEKLTPAYEFAN